MDSALMTDRAVDPFPKEIGMPVVPGILLDHVGAGEAHVQLKVAAWMREQIVQRPAPEHLTRSRALCLEYREVRLGLIGGGLIEVTARVHITEPGQACDAAPQPPAFHFSHVPDQAKQAKARRGDRAVSQLLPDQSTALPQQRRTVKVQEAGQRARLIIDQLPLGSDHIRCSPWHAVGLSSAAKPGQPNCADQRLGA
jgi:hypothetical protein